MDKTKLEQLIVNALVAYNYSYKPNFLKVNKATLRKIEPEHLWYDLSINIDKLGYPGYSERFRISKAYYEMMTKKEKISLKDYEEVLLKPNFNFGFHLCVEELYKLNKLEEELYLLLKLQ